MECRPFDPRKTWGITNERAIELEKLLLSIIDGVVEDMEHACPAEVFHRLSTLDLKVNEMYLLHMLFFYFINDLENTVDMFNNAKPRIIKE